MATVMDKTIAEKVIRTLETPWNFVSTSDGKSYGELVQAASEDPSIDLSEGQDSIYNPEKAKEELELAKKELTDVSWPIVLDLLTDDASASLPKQAASIEQSIEKSLGSENIDIVVHSVMMNTQLLLIHLQVHGMLVGISQLQQAGVLTTSILRHT